jgi:hypothetical protein
MRQVFERESGCGGVIAMAAVFLLFVYVLSIGPAIRLARHLPTPQLTVLVGFYKPIDWLRENSPLKTPINAYLPLWGAQI